MAHLVGQCHCGGVRAEVATRLPAERIAVRACQCGFCRRHGARTFSDPQGQARLASRRPLTRYRFGEGTADFLICPGCGVYVGAAIQEGGQWFATLNAAGLQVRPLSDAEPQPVAYDAETAAQRRARRLVRWTPITLDETPGGRR